MTNPPPIDPSKLQDEAAKLLAQIHKDTEGLKDLDKPLADADAHIREQEAALAKEGPDIEGLLNEALTGIEQDTEGLNSAQD